MILVYSLVSFKKYDYSKYSIGTIFPSTGSVRSFTSKTDDGGKREEVLRNREGVSLKNKQEARYLHLAPDIDVAGQRYARAATDLFTHRYCSGLAWRTQTLF